MKSLTQLKAESKPETLLKKREKADEERVYSEIAKQKEELESRKRARTPSIKKLYKTQDEFINKLDSNCTKNVVIIKTLASFVSSEKNKQKNQKALMVRMKKNREDIPDTGILLLVRIHISVHAANPIKKALHLLRLDGRFTATLVKSDPVVKSLIQTVEPFIIFGVPSPGLVDKLVRKRGKVIRKGIEVELRDNNFVEEELQDFGILCIDDLIYELVNNTNNFSVASKFLCPFKLNFPPKKFKKTPWAKGGDYGFREDISSIVESMI
jgi:large subunit ribosomal protein L7e